MNDTQFKRNAVELFHDTLRGIRDDLLASRVAPCSDATTRHETPVAASGVHADDLSTALRQELIRDRRTLVELSRLSGIHRTCLSRFLGGHSAMSLMSAGRLAAVLNLELRPK